MRGTKTKTYKVQERETGYIFDCALTIEEATALLARYEAKDKEGGCYEDDFYEVAEEHLAFDVIEETRGGFANVLGTYDTREEAEDARAYFDDVVKGTVYIMELMH